MLLLFITFTLFCISLSLTFSQLSWNQCWVGIWWIIMVSPRKSSCWPTVHNIWILSSLGNLVKQKKQLHFVPLMEVRLWCDLFMWTCNVSKQGINSEKMLSLHLMCIFPDLTGRTEENATGYIDTTTLWCCGSRCACACVCSLCYVTEKEKAEDRRRCSYLPLEPCCNGTSGPQSEPV